MSRTFQRYPCWCLSPSFLEEQDVELNRNISANRGFVRNCRPVFPLRTISGIFQPEWFPVRQMEKGWHRLSQGMLTGQAFQRLSCLLGNWFSRLWDLINRVHPTCLPPPCKMMGCINLWLYLSPYINYNRNLLGLQQAPIFWALK